jgi:hypothetical protein
MASEQSNPMKRFVVIFRQGPRTLSDPELQKRAEETSLWARGVNEAGHRLDPRILTAERVNSGNAPADVSVTGAALITALLFLEAADLSEAAAIAESHPGLRYGALAEVRPWGAPAPLGTPR